MPPKKAEETGPEQQSIARERMAAWIAMMERCILNGKRWSTWHVGGLRNA